MNHLRSGGQLTFHIERPSESSAPGWYSGRAAYAASRLIDSRLYSVAAQDPLTLALATGLLLAVALSATYLPAQRASRLDPITALRQF